MVSYKYTFDIDTFQIFGKLCVYRQRSREIYHYSITCLFNDENLVIYKVVCLIGVELYISEIIYAYLAFCENCLLECVFVHVNILLKQCGFICFFGEDAALFFFP